MALNSNLCISCHQRPKYVDGSKTHPYCGKTCANKMKIQPAPSVAGVGNCSVCHSRPKYVQGTKIHDYCSKTCAKTRRASGPAGIPLQPPGPTAASRLPAISPPQQIQSNAFFHTSIAKTACLMCGSRTKQPQFHYCSIACGGNAAKKAPFLLEVPVVHETFADVAEQFKKSWRHSGSCPPVKAVYKIIVTGASMKRYDMYRDAVETRGQFVRAKKSAGNECRRWHGTNRQCKLGDKGETNFCSSTTCSLCSIVKSSYDINFFGKKTGWGRFGSGIYLSSTSSKSDAYSRNYASSAWKAMILNKVIVGRGYKIKQDSPSMTSPPAGYDSVLGETGSSLNHDELIVYNNDAVRPSWLIMYSP